MSSGSSWLCLWSGEWGISSLREWSLLFIRHGPHPNHPSLVSFLWMILVSSLLPCPSNFLPKRGTDLTSLCQNQENPVPAKEFHMVHFLSLQTLTFQHHFFASPLFLIPVLLLLWRLLQLTYHRGFSPRDFSNPINYGRIWLELGEHWASVCESTFFILAYASISHGVAQFYVTLRWAG